MGVSLDGVNYSGYFYEGVVNETISLDLSAVPTLENILGQPQVWVGFVFYSDEDIAASNGAQIDDVILAVDMPAANQAPVVSLTAPNGGETLSAGDTQAITYTASDTDGGPSAMTMAFDYSTNSGGTWVPIVTGQSNTGSYNWTVPNLSSATARVRVRADDGADETSDASDADFSIVQNQNTLDLGDASGPSGTSVTVQLALENEDAVKGIQADIIFDGTKAFFSGVTTTARSTGMVVDGEQISENLARLILYFDDNGQLAPGSGDVADVTFTLQGPGGGSTPLTLSDLILSDPAGNPLVVTGTNGLLTVAEPLEVPGLQISVLNNPGRNRTLQILVRVSNGSGSVPTVAAGGANVVMTSIGQAVYVGPYFATEISTGVTISASDTNSQGTGTAQTTVSFQ